MRIKAGLELGKIVELRRVDLVGDITNDSVSSQRLSPRCPTTLFQILSRSVQTQAVTGQFARQQWPLARPGEQNGNVGLPLCGIEESAARRQVHHYIRILRRESVQMPRDDPSPEPLRGPDPQNAPRATTPAFLTKPPRAPFQFP